MGSIWGQFGGRSTCELTPSPGCNGGRLSGTGAAWHRKAPGFSPSQVPSHLSPTQPWSLFRDEKSATKSRQKCAPKSRQKRGKNIRGRDQTRATKVSRKANLAALARIERVFTRHRHAAPPRDAHISPVEVAEATVADRLADIVQILHPGKLVRSLHHKRSRSEKKL